MKPLSSFADLADPAAVAHLHHVLREGGAQALIRSLNARVPHRITGFYRLKREVLATLCLHDKLGVLKEAMLADVPLTDSFCQFAMRDGFFETIDSSQDDRLIGHLYRGKVLSYHGVPVLNAAGEVAGSLCHLDHTKQSLARPEFEVLRAMALSLPPFLDMRASLSATQRMPV